RCDGLLRRLGSRSEAAEAYRKAHDPAGTDAERRYLERRRREVPARRRFDRPGRRCNRLARTAVSMAGREPRGRLNHVAGQSGDHHREWAGHRP
ncbi:MAG: hypothetical protein ABSE98_11815, partial [Acidimicrobiales bacterium]